jgi:ketosteroid isomerase-like protein
MRKFIFTAVMALVIAAVGCSTGAPPPPSVLPPVQRQRTPTPVPKTDEEAIRQLIVAEGEAVVQQDIDRLQGMWASDGVVTDANRTPNNPSDDKTWKGWAALRDRYVNIVFPSNPAFAEHPNIRVTMTGDTATAIADTKIGITNLKDNDRWTFRKIDGQWRITSLTFSLASQ